MPRKALVGISVAVLAMTTTVSAAIAAAPALITANPPSSLAAPIVLTAGDATGRTITFSNGDKSVSTSALVVTLIGSGFSKVSDTCSGIALGPRKTCSVRVAFAGAASAASNASMTVGAKNKPAAATSYFTVLPPPTITVAVQAFPNDAQDFPFTTTGTGPASWTDGFNLDDDSTAELSNTATFTVPPGSKTLSASTVNGWSSSGFSCAGVAVTYPNGQMAAFTLVAGDAVHCSYTSSKDATISITKSASPADGTDFGFSGDLGPFMLDDGGLPDAINSTETFTIPGTQAGTKTITETALPGWSTTDIDCTGTQSFTPDLENQSVNVLVDWGDTVSCTFTNQPPT